MFAFGKGLLVVGRYFRRIAIALEKLASLYELDLAHRGIRPMKLDVHDEVEVSYGSIRMNEDED